MWIIILVVLLVSTSALADDYIVRDEKGCRVGTIEQGIGERLIRRVLDACNAFLDSNVAEEESRRLRMPGRMEA